MKWHRQVVGMVATLALAAGASSSQACSQCMCGTPFPADALGGVVPIQIRYGLEERYLSKANGMDEGPGSEQEREHRVSGFALWRAADRLAMLGRVPYNVKELTESPAGSPSSNETSRGFGDAELLALIGVSHVGGAHGHTLGAVLGVTAPTGSNVARDETGARLDAHLQPGAGAWSGTAGLNLALATGVGTLEASVLGRTSGTSAHGYRYGDALLYNLGLSRGAGAGITLLAQLNARSANRDRQEDGTLGANTGGTVVYASPGLRWRSGFGIGLEAAVQVPVVKSLDGAQDEHTTGRLSLSLER